MKRSPHLIMYFERGRLVVENYITRQRFQAAPDTLVLLEQFDVWKTVREASKILREYSEASVTHSARNLLGSGLLITRDSEQDRLGKRFSDKWLWPIPSRYYHFTTKLDERPSTSEEVRKFYNKYLRGKSQPSIYKRYHGKTRIRLPPRSRMNLPILETLRRRQTVRRFSNKPISLGEMSTIVYYTWGRLSTYKTKEFGALLHKTSPSAGARHPIEAYAVVNNVEGIPCGIYHYSVEDHSLELLEEGDYREKCVDFAAGQAWTRNASVLFIMTAVVSRTAWKYRIARAYRALLLDTGHLSQTFLLVCTALRLGAFCIGIISDIAVEKELEIDGVAETVLFAVGVGHPA